MKIPKVNFMALDLEMNQPSGKIIQLGAVIGNILTGEILERISLFVDPEEPLNPEIVDLCAITEDMIAEEGKELEDQYHVLCDLHEKHNCSKMPIVWGSGDRNDSSELRLQLRKIGMVFNMGYGDHTPEPQFLFGHRIFDAKTLMQTKKLINGESLQGGLAKSLTKLGLKFEGKKHNAMDDAYNTFIIYRELAKAYK